VFVAVLSVFSEMSKVLFVNVSVVARYTNVSLVSCNVHVRAAVMLPVSAWVKPPWVRLRGRASVGLDPMPGQVMG
jgi:hypothetical protein